VNARPITAAPAAAPTAAHPATHAAAPRAPAVHRATGRVEALQPGSVTLSHGPVPALGWPAMTMPFVLSQAARPSGLAVGDRVQFAFEMKPDKATIRSLSRVEAQP